MDSKTIEFYNNNADELSTKYNSASPDYIELFKRFLKPNSNILDIGAGSGRDMNILQELGHDIYGIEPSINFIKKINENYPNLKHIKNESLPYLSFKNNTFDAVISIATLQHIPENQLQNSINKIHSILKPKGTVIISIPTKYPNITNNRDKNSRLFHIRPKEEYENILKQKGFTLIYQQSTQNDALNRQGIEWTTLVFKKFNR